MTNYEANIKQKRYKVVFSFEMQKKEAKNENHNKHYTWKNWGQHKDYSLKIYKELKTNLFFFYETTTQ